jgi:hypothetical protein
MTADTITKRKRGPRSLLCFAKRDAKKRGLKWLLGEKSADRVNETALSLVRGAGASLLRH